MVYQEETPRIVEIPDDFSIRGHLSHLCRSISILIADCNDPTSYCADTRTVASDQAMNPIIIRQSVIIDEGDHITC
jgi:hypothetical protein